MKEAVKRIYPDTRLAEAVAVCHMCDTVPIWWEFTLVCRKRDVGFKRGDEVRLSPESITSSFVTYATSHFCMAHFSANQQIRIDNGEPIDNLKWRLRLRVVK